MSIENKIDVKTIAEKVILKLYESAKKVDLEAVKRGENKEAIAAFVDSLINNLRGNDIQLGEKTIKAFPEQREPYYAKLRNLLNSKTNDVIAIIEAIQNDNLDRFIAIGNKINSEVIQEIEKPIKEEITTISGRIRKFIGRIFSFLPQKIKYSEPKPIKIQPAQKIRMKPFGKIPLKRPKPIHLKPELDEEDESGFLDRAA